MAESTLQSRTNMKCAGLFLLCSIFMLFTSACSGVLIDSPDPTLEPTFPPSGTIPPPLKDILTATPGLSLPADASPQFAEPSPTITPLVLPSDPPVTLWMDIPILPEALAGQEDSDGYTYTINLAVRKVMHFYSKTLKQMAWEVQATGSKTGALLIARKGNIILSIAIRLHESGITIVRLAMDNSE